MSIRSPHGAAATAPRRVAAVLAGLPILFLLLGGCGQRMAVKVNGEVVSQDEFYKRCANNTQGQLIAPPVGVMVLNELILDQLLTQEARRLKLEPTDAEVDAELATYRKRASAAGQSLDDRIKQSGLPIDAVKQSIRRQLLQQKLFTQGVTVTDKEIEDYYKQNKQNPQFTTPEQVEAREITVATEAAAKEVKQTLDKNAAFELVAQSKSIDQYKAQGGKLPPLQHGYPQPGINPEIVNEAFKTPEGKITEPSKVGNNWVILKVDKKTPQTTRTLADTKEEIRQVLLQQKAYQSGQAMKFQTRLMELRRDADIQFGMDQYKEPLLQQQQQLKQAPTSGLAPALPGH
jgi:foldase protein PrsA